MKINEAKEILKQCYGPDCDVPEHLRAHGFLERDSQLQPLLKKAVDALEFYEKNAFDGYGQFIPNKAKETLSDLKAALTDGVGELTEDVRKGAQKP